MTLASAALGGFGRVGQAIAAGFAASYIWHVAACKRMTGKNSPWKMSESIQDLHHKFADDGYVHLKPLVDMHEVAEVLQNVQNVIDNIDKIPTEDKFYDVKGESSSLKQIQRLNVHSEYFANFAARVQVLASELMGEEAVLRNIQYFNKPPVTSKPTPAHQDGFYFHIKPNHAVTMWLALDDADEENGCLIYSRGSHKKGMRNHQASGVLGFSQKCTDYGTNSDLKAEKVMSAKPGEMVAHNSFMLHRANANTSKTRQRRAIGFVFYAVAVEEDVEKAEAYQRQLHSQLRASGKI